MIYSSIEELIKEYDLYNVNKDNELEKYGNKVIFEGHSLGGELAKLMGKIKNKGTISLSGLVDFFNYEGNTKNFELSPIDIIPDKDMIP